MSDKNNVTKTVRSNLCCSCGLCAGYCNKKAISYKVNKLGFYEPIVDTKQCVDCGVCINSCPGQKDLKNYENREESYIYGYSLNPEMRLNASSGGITTELLCYLLEKGFVDYVTCVTNRTANDLPHQILTNDPKVVRQSRTSKYCPIAWGDILKEIEHVDGMVAVIALPCQINSLKHYYIKRQTRNKIKFYISLMCNHTPSLHATNYLVKGLGGKKLDSIIYRGEGFPGVMKVNLTVGLSQAVRLARLPYRRTWAAGYGKYFKNMRCMVCNDPFAKNADIVMGDSYFLQETDTKGTTFCIVRNEFLKTILNEMNKESVIFFEEGPDLQTQRKYYKVLFNRENDFPILNKILKKMGKKIETPMSDTDREPTLRNVLGFIKMAFMNSLGKYHFLWGYLAKKNNLKSLILK